MLFKIILMRLKIYKVINFIVQLLYSYASRNLIILINLFKLLFFWILKNHFIITMIWFNYAFK